MLTDTTDPLSWFPYLPRPHQDKAVYLSAEVFGSKNVGLLSADCGVGKTIAVLSGYLAARYDDPTSRLFALTRTHSQSKVFEEELSILREQSLAITATSMVSRVHVCPIRAQISSNTSTGFTKACSQMVKMGRCTHYWNMYKRHREEGKLTIRNQIRSLLEELLDTGVVSRDRAEDFANLHTLCPYEVLRWCARNSRVVIGPYSYMFKSRVRDSLLASVGVHLHELDLLIDEAHNLPSHVLDSETARLTGEDLRYLKEHSRELVRETRVDWIGEVVDFLWETLMVKLDSFGNRREIKLDKWDVVPRFIEKESLDLLVQSHDLSLGDPENAVHAENPFDRFVDFLLIGSKAVESEDWHISLNLMKNWHGEKTPLKTNLAIRPLNAAGLTAPVLRGARSALLMSGTLRPLEHYGKLLGVSGALKEDLESPYPKGSRLVLIDKKLSTKYTERSSELWRLLAERINAVLNTMPANKSAMIAFPSYHMMREILSYSIDTGYRGKIIEDRGARLEFVTEAIEERPQAVFCVYGGKFSEGIDIVKDGSSMIDLIIGVGIPFSPPTSYQQAIQDWYNRKFGEGLGYYYSSVVPSLRQVAQLIGRLRRSPSDWGVVTLLDNRFMRYLSILGDGIVSDIWPYESVSEIRSAITSFVEMRMGDNCEIF
ncbi:MAG: ATP-dependent DNA helicase [Candidatus Thorarchaeota archaeon]|nr:MAG: ATP-dependent DNA helicase [Candidatus Thorarchaeota archaeon]